MTNEQLLQSVYTELRKLAAAKLAHESPGHTLDPTALVHEAYLRLIATASWDSRGHFFAAAAEAMRRILVDHARARKAVKRGGDQVRLTLDDPPARSRRDDEILAVHESLDKLAQSDAMAAELVKLRYFAGLTAAEAAQTLGLSQRSASRLWVYARAWLRTEIQGSS